MAIALYRKYRPATFAEVAGQDHVTEPLRTALAAQRINHAYLFSGPRGCGKTSSARILARSLNCAQGPTPDPCGECESCVALAPEGPGNVDVVELDAASHGGVDDARELRDRAFFAPAHSRYRIFVIDEAHMVTTQGFNALLKIVEEPPPHLIFVFATTEPDKVITTIRSRTHHYPFRLMPPGTMRELLQRICDEEGVRVEPAVHPLVIRAGGGSARDTLSIMDQLLAGSDERGVTYERAVALLGVTDVALIDDMVDALAASDGAAVYGTVDRLVEAGHDPRRFASDLLDRLRDLVLLHSVPDAAERGLVDVDGDELTKMQSESEQLGAATLSRFAEIVHTGLSEMRGATAPRLLLELLCARMLLPGVSDSETALLQRLERVENRMTIAPSGSSGAQPEDPPGTAGQDAGGHRVYRRPSERPGNDDAEAPAPERPAGTSMKDSSGPAPAPSEAPAAEAPAAQEKAAASPAPPPAEPAPDTGPPQDASPGPGEPAAGEPAVAEAATGQGFDAAAVRRVWTELLRAVAERNRPTQALLLNATVQDLRDGALVLSMPTSGLVKQFAQQHRIEFVRDAMRAVIGGEWDVRCVEAGGTDTVQNGQSSARPAQKSGQQSTQQSTQRSAQQSAQQSAQEPAQPRENPQQQPPSQGSEPPSWTASAASNDPAQNGPPSNGPPSNGSAPNGSSGAPAKPADGERQRSAPRADDDIPPPPEPPPEEPPPEEDHVPESSGAVQTVEHSRPAPARDPQLDAEQLFTNELGARRID